MATTWRRRILAAVTVVAVLSGAALALRLASQERTGPPHAELTIGGDVPATFYVPGEVDRDIQEVPDPRPEGSRPPVVVLAHGFGVDRPIMSPIARSLVAHGYAVVSFDWPGHGAHRGTFHDGSDDDLRDDLAKVVDWAATSPWVDPDRIVLVGHSMGAGAVLDLATRDPRPAAVVPISGGGVVDGPERPRNVGLVVASGDPDAIRDRARHAYEQLTGRPAGSLPARSGTHADGSAASLVEIGGVDHGTILFSGKAVDAVVRWLDDSLGIERAGVHGVVDARLGTAVLYLLVLLVLLFLVGTAAGRFAQPLPEVSGRGAWGGLLVLVAAFALVSPFVAGAAPAGFVEIAVGDSLQSVLALTGGAVLVVRAATARRLLPALPESWLGANLEVRKTLQPALLPALLTMAAVYVLMLPLGPVVHRLVPTPERLVMVPVLALLTLPFTIAFQTLLRRGGTVSATVRSVVGRVVLLALLFFGSALQVLPGVVVIIVPFLAVVLVLVEVTAVAVYRSGRNVAVIALVEALWLGWISAAILPIGFGPLA